MRISVLAAAAAILAAPVPDPAAQVRARIEIIQSGKARRGAVYTFTSGELNAYARRELPLAVPRGVRQPRLELGTDSATGYALIDFLKLQSDAGGTPWLIAKLIEGERPVKVSARIRSAGGRATVSLERVEISGLAVSGATLDFLIRNFFLPLYPNAKINQPFGLGDRVERIEVNPASARVVMER